MFVLSLLHLNARYYDPELGLFLQPDWFEVTEPGVGTNRYAYSANDPINARDPYGNNYVKKLFEEVFGGAKGSLDDAARQAGEEALQNGMDQLRDQAVKEAWHQERELLKIGKGTRPWTPKQRKKILSNGKLTEYHGHHKNSVAAHPSEAGDPNNIEFLTIPRHKKTHNGNWRNPTTGTPIDRNAIYKKATGQDIPAYPRKTISYNDVIEAAGRASNRSISTRVLNGISNTLNALPPDPISMGYDFVTGKWHEDLFDARCGADPDSCT